MRTTTLGHNGPEVGVIGLGCMGMTFSYDMETPRDVAISISVIHRASARCWPPRSACSGTPSRR